MKWKFNCHSCGTVYQIEHRQLHKTVFYTPEKKGRPTLSCRECKVKAIFEPSGLRADVIDADTGVVYEVYQTEGMDSLKKKAEHYPLEVRFINANEDFTEDMLL